MTKQKHTCSIIGHLVRCVRHVGVFVLVCTLVAASGFVARSLVSAQTENTQPAPLDARRAELERELAVLEKQIAAQQVVLDGKQRERVSIERDVAILDAKIEKAKLSIRARDLELKRIATGIGTQKSIMTSLTEKALRERESLAQLIRKTNQIDNTSLVEVVLSNKNFSDFFADLDSFASIKDALNNSFREIELVHAETSREKETLESKHSEELELRQLQQLEKERIEEQEREKAKILKITRGEEQVYQDILDAQEQSAAEIRAALFALRGSAAIPFGVALSLAERASRETGVRPALILGVIAEESNLGENVGTGTWREDMHPDRDAPVFKEITARLGLDPDAMPVSKKPWYGWGGAMGPAQFIPSTWILYEKRIAELTGHNPPNPWDPEDAFMASGVLLADNGADRGGHQAERLAALRYFAGWKNAEKPTYAFYGDDVMALAAKYQKQIDILTR